MTDAARQDAWRKIVSEARTANLVAFSDCGVAVLDRERSGAPSEDSLLWDSLASAGARAEIVKFNVRGVLVLVW
jgi:hypothetical protein